MTDTPPAEYRGDLFLWQAADGRLAVFPFGVFPPGYWIDTPQRASRIQSVTGFGLALMIAAATLTLVPVVVENSRAAALPWLLGAMVVILPLYTLSIMRAVRGLERVRPAEIPWKLRVSIWWYWVLVPPPRTVLMLGAIAGFVLAFGGFWSWAVRGPTLLSVAAALMFLFAGALFLVMLIEKIRRRI